MPKATPGSRSTDSSSPRARAASPTGFDLNAIVPRELCDDVGALSSEAEALEEQVQNFAVRCFRALARVQAAELDADDTQGVGGTALMLAEEHSGVGRLTEIVEAMIDHLEVARLERPSSVPGWVSTEIDAMDSWFAAWVLPWLDDTSSEAPMGDAS